MSRNSPGLLQRLLTGLALSLVAVFAAGGTVQAGTLTMFVQQTGFSAVQIDDGGIYDVDGVVNGVITVNTPLLNNDLALAGWTLKFSDLGAISNSLVGGVSTASLSQTGTVLLDPGAASTSVTIMATDIDWNSPTGPGLRLYSSGNANFTGTKSGDTSQFQSWYNPSNILAAMDNGTSPLLYQSTGPVNNAYGSNNSAVFAPLVPFGMTNLTTITLSDGGTGNPPKNQFTGSTTLEVVPEPASMALLGISLPLTLFGLRFLRRRSA